MLNALYLIILFYNSRSYKMIANPQERIAILEISPFYGTETGVFLSGNTQLQFLILRRRDCFEVIIPSGFCFPFFSEDKKISAFKCHICIIQNNETVIMSFEIIEITGAVSPSCFNELNDSLKGTVITCARYQGTNGCFVGV